MGKEGQKGQAQDDSGNTNSRPSVSKFWCFTLNNWLPVDLVTIQSKFEDEGIEYVIGREVGESGTPHLQGYIECENEIRPMESLKLMKEIHWEKRCKRGTRAHNIAYCTKDWSYVTNMGGVPECPVLPVMSGWQVDVLLKLKQQPDNRSIMWYWSYEGGRGKSSLCRYLAITQGAIVCAGKAADMKYQIAQYKQKKGFGPRLVIFDVPRSSENFLSYTGIEEIKNGVFASNKYESDMCIIAHPHVLVLANFQPDMQNKDMSSDRFDCVNVDEMEDFVF